MEEDSKSQSNGSDQEPEIAPTTGTKSGQRSGASVDGSSSATTWRYATIALGLLLIAAIIAVAYLGTRVMNAERVADENAKAAKEWEAEYEESSDELGNAKERIGDLQDQRRSLTASKSAVEDQRAALKLQAARLSVFSKELSEAVSNYDLAAEQMRACSTGMLDAAVAIAEQNEFFDFEGAGRQCMQADRDLASARDSIPEGP